MDIVITNSSGKPIYEQIAEQVRMMVMDGTLREGDALPSMRALAKDLRVSVITTKRAYEELERGGFIESYTGRGSFVSAVDPALMRERVLAQVEERLDGAVQLARSIDLSADDMHDLLDLCLDADAVPSAERIHS